MAIAYGLFLSLLKMQYEHSERAIPISIQSQDLFMLKIAKPLLQNEYLDNQSALSNRDSRYNTKLNDTIDQERVNKNVDVACNRQKVVTPKSAKKSAQPDNNIALYDLRDSQNLNNQYAIGNILPERLKAIRDTKIMTPNAWMKDYGYVDKSYEKSGIPEIYNEGEDLRTFPTDKESFESAFTNAMREGPMKQQKAKLSDFGYGLNMSDGNYNGYISALMPSETNVPPTNIYDNYESDYIQPNAAMFPDMRLQQNLQTQQRQITDENSRIIMMQNLRESPYIKERNARQIEANNYLNHNGKLKLPMLKTQEYENFLDEQNNGMEYNYTIDQDMADLKNKFNDRNSGGMKYSKNFDKLGNYYEHIDVCANAVSSDDLNKEIASRVYAYNTNEPTKLSRETENKTINTTNFNTVIDDRDIDRRESQQLQYVDDANKQKFINLEYKDKNKESFVPQRNIERRVSQEYKQGVYDARADHVQHFSDKQKFANKDTANGEYAQRNQIGTSSYPMITILRGQGYINKEFFNKNNHILIQRKGTVSNVYSNPNSDDTAPVLVSLDINNKPIRTMATKNNNSLYIIQKRDPTYIDIVTGNYYKDDYSVMKIPINEVPTTLRRNIEIQYQKQNGKINTTSNRSPSKILSLEYDDLVTLSNLIYQNPEKCKRVSSINMRHYIESSEIDKNLMFGPDEKIFTSPYVVEQMLKNDREKEARIHTDTSPVKRVEKETYSTYRPSINIPQRDEQFSCQVKKNYLGTMGDNPYINSNSYNMRNTQAGSHYYSFENM